MDPIKITHNKFWIEVQWTYNGIGGATRFSTRRYAGPFRYFRAAMFVMKIISST